MKRMPFLTKEDLQEELNHNKIKKYAIYTVKEVKGLEFQEVITVDRDMTENEKYISYTRALMKLTVIHNLPYHTDHSKTLYINGTNAEEVIEEWFIVLSLQDYVFCANMALLSEKTLSG